MMTLASTKPATKSAQAQARARNGHRGLPLRRGTAARPTTVRSPGASATAYAEKEYGVTPAELQAAAQRAKAEIARDRRAGRLTPYTGNFHAALGD